MTRAKQSLLLAQMDGQAHMLDGIERTPGLMFRESPRPESVPAELYRQHERADLTEVDLGFAGRFAAGKKVHRSIEKLQPGDYLELRERDGKWELFDSSGNLVGRMARAFKRRSGVRIREASVAAVLARVEADVDPEYQDRFRVPKWEVVVPQFVLEPKGMSTSKKGSAGWTTKSRRG
jgi:hypothetical protein